MTATAERRLSRPARNVLRILEKDLDLGRRLLAVANAETDALLANDSARVEALELEAATIVVEQQAHAGARRDAIADLAAALGIEADESHGIPALSQMMLRVPLPEARKLVRARTAILAVEQEIQSANARNFPLLENALQFVQFSLHVITCMAFRPSRYGAKAVATPAFLVNQKC